MLSKILAAGLGCLPLLAAQTGVGQALFEGKGGCLQCHAVANHGGDLGPDLSDIGVMRGRESLRLALTDPDAEVQPGYFTIVAVMKDGRRLEGIRLNEDDFSIQIRDTGGNLRSLQKDKLSKFTRELRSLMPSYARQLSAAEIDALVAYLQSLKAAVTPGTRSRAIAPVSERLDWLTRPDRDGDERPETVLDALKIPEGAAVADVGAGAGYFTWRLARRVGQGGKVFAVEIQPKLLDAIAAGLKKRNIANVELVLGEADNPRLPDAALDLVLLANAYHEFAEPEAMMAAIRRSLKPGGRVAIIEYRKEDVYSPVDELHKMNLLDVRREIESMGFETERVMPDILPTQHFLIFRKQR